MIPTNELIQALDAAAQAATPGDWTPDDNFGFTVQCYRTGLDRLLATVNGPNAENDTRFIALASPQNILRVLAERDADKALIAELQGIRAAAEKLVRCKGRYHSEQNYRALAALFGVNTPDLPPLDGEARTLTVKLPESVIDAICLTAAEIHNLGRGVSDDRAQEIINSIRCAAGITLIVGV